MTSEMLEKDAQKYTTFSYHFIRVVKMSGIERDSRGHIMALFSCRPSHRTIQVQTHHKCLRLMDSEEMSEIHNNKHQKSENGSKFEGLNDSQE